MTEGRLNPYDLAEAGVIEEMGEVAQVLMKIRRFGITSSNPYRPEEGNNRLQLTREVGDLYGVLDMLVEDAALDTDEVERRRSTKRGKMENLNRGILNVPVGDR